MKNGQGLPVTREELDSGALKTKLAPSDYDTTCLVSFLLLILTFSDRLSVAKLGKELLEISLLNFPLFRILTPDFP